LVVLLFMRNHYLILAMAISVSACSSQQVPSIAGQLWEWIDPTPSRYDVKYDEAAIFPAPNQRLACQMDWTCKKPLTEVEFDRLSDEDKFRVKHGDDLESKN
jgi:hypothetical protein